MQSTTNFNNNDKTDESVTIASDQTSTNNVAADGSNRKIVNENLCKVFIGNIPRTATEEQLKDFFEQKNVQFKEMSLMKDPVNPAMNRGFGFFTLNSEEETDSLLFLEMDAFQGKTLDIKRAAPKDVDDPLIQTKTERVFVGGLPQVYTVEEITELFNDKYANVGKVLEVIPKKDKITGKSRGFCFIVFDNFHVVDKIMIDNRFPYLNNKRLEVRKASSDFPILGGPPIGGGGGDAGGGMMRRSSGGPSGGGKISRGGDRNQRMNQNPYRNGGGGSGAMHNNNNMPNMRHPPRRQQSPYMNSHPMHGGGGGGSQYPRQSYGYTNRPPPSAYTETNPSGGGGMGNPHMQPQQPSYGSHLSDVSSYGQGGGAGANASYVPYCATSQPMPSAYSTGNSQYAANPYGNTVNYAVNQGGVYQPPQMPPYSSSSNTNNVGGGGSSSNPPPNQNHPGY